MRLPAEGAPPNATFLLSSDVLSSQLTIFDAAPRGHLCLAKGGSVLVFEGTPVPRSLAMVVSAAEVEQLRAWKAPGMGCSSERTAISCPSYRQPAAARHPTATGSSEAPVRAARQRLR